MGRSSAVEDSEPGLSSGEVFVGALLLLLAVGMSWLTLLRRHAGLGWVAFLTGATAALWLATSVSLLLRARFLSYWLLLITGLPLALGNMVVLGIRERRAKSEQNQ
ncbi:hypothetical protein [Armatimonas rosea]|uniref:Uncharacterized protein n=1 Tax=Armatimonas rosea TaxID=685828 RepID=A0A7W9SPI8_ARMRO|nr:hypothetical protein [Armatimonas rosea]MBB6049839.1 hypothetical protein [Armatimonas rosea]